MSETNGYPVNPFAFMTGKGRRLPAGFAAFSTTLLALLFSPPLAAGGQIQFPSTLTTLPTEESQVLSFQVPEASTEEQFPEWKIEPAGSLEMLLPPHLLAGEKTGYFRVRPLKAGSGSVQIGETKLEIRIKENPKKAGHDHLPEFVTPASGSAVWGKLYAAVEIFATDIKTQKAKLDLSGSDGKTYEADPALSSQSGPWRREVFALDADTWPKGPYLLTPRLASDQGKAVEGKAILLSNSPPDPNNQITGECEDYLEPSELERFKNKPLPAISEDKTASGGKDVTAYSGNTAWTLKTEIREAGAYQLFMTVRGDPAAGALPSLGYYVDEGDKTSGNVRLAIKDWHRVPVGLPVHFEQGTHSLAVQFRNDLNVNKVTDRNLWLDRFELAKVQSSGKGEDKEQDPSMMNMMASDPSMVMAAMDSTESAASTEPIKLAFRYPFDGKEINGPVSLHALCRWTSYEPGNAPAVDLILNGKKISTQYGSELNFELGLDQFHAGSNSVQLLAKSGSNTFRSSVQHLNVAGPASWKVDTGMNELVFGILDPAWDPGMHQRWEGKPGFPRNEAAFYTNGESFIRLPAKLQGRFKVELEGRGQSFNGPPVFEVLLRGKDGDNPVGSIQMDGGHVQKTAGTVDLPPGQNQLVIRFANDAFQEKGGDRNAWLKRVRLVAMPSQPEPEIPLNLRVSYPRPDSIVGSCGLLVLDGLGIRRGDRAEVQAGDKVLGFAEAPHDGLGSWIVPWINRDAVAGPGQMSLRILRGKDKNQVMQMTVPVQFAGPEFTNDYDKAVHLLNRFAYGPEPELVAEILTQGLEPWLEKQLRQETDTPLRKSLDETLSLNFNGDDKPNDIAGRVLSELQQTPNPVRARFDMWAENHFSTWQQKAGPLNKWREHESFERQGVARFKDLLVTSASSPAMLIYLDQRFSFAKKLNENYAREILELHTVGVKGGYNQKDVTSLAGLLTGWTLSEEASLVGTSNDLVSTFRYEPGLNAKGPQQVMGMAFPEVPEEQRYDRACMVLEMLAMHPSTAHFISRQLAEQYVGSPAPEELVDSLAKVYLESGGDLPAVLLELARQPAFWESRQSPRMTTPQDYAVRMGRMLNPGDTPNANSFLKLSGMAFFDRPTPDGYPPSDASYADSNALLQRWRWSSQFRFGPLRLPWERQPPSTWTVEQAQQAIDWLSMRLNGRLLGEQSNAALLQWLSAKNEAHDDMGAQLGIMIARVPESNIR